MRYLIRDAVRVNPAFPPKCEGVRGALERYLLRPVRQTVYVITDYQGSTLEAIDSLKKTGGSDCG